MKCYCCNKDFKRFSGLTYHLRKKHQNVNVFDFYKQYYYDI